MSVTELLLSLINSLALFIVALIGWGVRHTLEQNNKQREQFQRSIEQLGVVLQDVRIAIGELRASFEAHTRLDDVRFKEINRRLEAVDQMDAS